MLKFHKPGRLRMLGGTAMIALLGGLSLAFGSAGATAQPAPPAPPAPPSPPSASAPQDGDHDNMQVIVRTVREERGERRGDSARPEHHGNADGERREERRVMVFTNRAGDGGNAAEHHRRMMEGHGPDGHMTMVGGPDCQDANRSEINEGTDNNRTRVIVCTRGERNPAQQAEALRRARARLAEDNQIPAEQRERVLAAIDREIARLAGSH